MKIDTYKLEQHYEPRTDTTLDTTQLNKDTETPSQEEETKDCDHKTVMHFRQSNRFQCTMCGKNMTTQYRNNHDF